MDKTKIYLPYSTHQIDFTHLIAVVSLNERYGASSKMSDLGGFGGDIAQLSIGLKNVDSELLQDTANNRMGSEDYAFGLKDYMADIDGINIGRDLSNNKVLTVSDALKNYYYKYDISFSTTKALSAINIAPTTIELAKSNLKYRLESNSYISGWLFTNNGTWITRPVSSVAGLLPAFDVSPWIPGSQSVMFNSTNIGGRTEKAFPL